jgi:hypothetical protein
MGTHRYPMPIGSEAKRRIDDPSMIMHELAARPSLTRKPREQLPGMLQELTRGPSTPLTAPTCDLYLFKMF